MTALPVLIIGSGLGGLNLANILQKHNIPYRIFERDSERDQRAQGYRVSLDGGGGGGVDGLAEALSPELFQEFIKSCGEQHSPGGRVDAKSGKVLQAGFLGLIGAGGISLILALGARFLSKRMEKWSWAGWKAWLSSSNSKSLPTVPPYAGESKGYQVDRRVLRTILLTTQTPHITFDSAFTSYTLSSESVTAHFANGTSVTGCLLVGADGIRSKVAAQLIGNSAAPLDLGMRVIYGKTVLTPEVEEVLHPTLQRGASFVVDTTSEGRKLLMVLESMRFHHPLAPENYVFWALAAGKEVFGIEGDGAGLFEVTSRLTKAWDPSIRIIIEKQAKDQTASLPLRSSNTESTVTWQTEHRVSVLGDAIHCMPPTGGQGANSALYDAALLGTALKDSYQGELSGWSAETIRKYEEAMRYNIGDIVGMACIGAQKLIL